MQVAAIRVRNHHPIAAGERRRQNFPNRGALAGARRAEDLDMLFLVIGREANARECDPVGVLFLPAACEILHRRAILNPRAALDDRVGRGAGEEQSRRITHHSRKQQRERRDRGLGQTDAELRPAPAQREPSAGGQHRDEQRNERPAQKLPQSGAALHETDQHRQRHHRIPDRQPPRAVRQCVPVDRGRGHSAVHRRNDVRRERTDRPGGLCRTRSEAR